MLRKRYPRTAKLWRLFFRSQFFHHMLYTLAVVLILLWLLGLLSSYTMGGFIHLLLVIAVIMVLLRIIRGRKIA